MREAQSEQQRTCPNERARQRLKSEVLRRHAAYQRCEVETRMKRDAQPYGAARPVDDSQDQPEQEAVQHVPGPCVKSREEPRRDRDGEGPTEYALQLRQ